MIVADAGVVITALTVDDADGHLARDRLRAEDLAGPELIDLEVASVLRRLSRAGRLPERRARLALSDLARLPLRRIAHRPLIRRCWELRENLTIYDAAYVAAAEALDVELVTTDAALARAPGPRCTIEVLGAG